MNAVTPRTLLLAGAFVAVGCAFLCSYADENVTKPIAIETVEQETSVQDLLAAIKELHGADVERRESALARIEELAKGGLSTEQVTALIDAATHRYPPPKFDLHSYDEAVLQATWRHLRDAHVPLITGAYPKLSERARPAALAALANLGSASATDAYIELLQRDGWPKGGYAAVVMPYEEDPRFETKLLVPLTDGSIPRIPNDLRWRVVLAYASKGKVSSAILPGVQAAAMRDTKAAVTRAKAFQRPTSMSWRWDDAYADARLEAGLLLDVLGHLGADPTSLELLRGAEGLSDPYLRLFGAVSLARLGERPSQPTLDAVAADSETRNALFDLLSEMGKRGLFPESQMTQKKLAESDMVRWLVYPTELGRAPDHIELMNTVERDLGPEAGVFVYYVFRFKTDPPHWSADDGWTAGVSGPFKKDFPTTKSWGDTFSTFTKWEQFSAAEHLSSIEELMERWREEHASK